MSIPETIAVALDVQSRLCYELGSPLYGDLMTAAAADVRTCGGPVVDALGDYPGDLVRDLVVLRLFGGVHRLVLQRRAGALGVHYPSVGGTYASPAGAWTAFREVVAGQVDELRTGLSGPPQTNEVGRSAALVGGLRSLRGGLPVRLRELGASAGLNLRADAFRIESADGSITSGPSDSPVGLHDAWRFAGSPTFGATPDVVERVGTDIAPVDPLSTQGRLTLTSFVWPDQRERLERLRGAFEVARRVPATLLTASAAHTVEQLDLADATTTVVWHSVMWQYLADSEQARVSAALSALGARATPLRRLAHLTYEPLVSEPGFGVRLREWPGDRDVVLGRGPAHGVPITWSSSEPSPEVSP